MHKKYYGSEVGMAPVDKKLPLWLVVLIFVSIGFGGWYGWQHLSHTTTKSHTTVVE